MTKRRKILDDLQASLDFDSPIEAYAALREELLKNQDGKDMPPADSYEECCNEISVAVKKALRSSGLSRDQLVDGVNDFFGKKKMTIHMLNNYLCRPASYNMPIPFLHAIQKVTGSLEPLIAQAEMAGAQIITGDEVRKLTLGKIDDAINELQRLKKTFRNQGGGWKHGKNKDVADK